MLSVALVRSRSIPVPLQRLQLVLLPPLSVLLLFLPTAAVAAAAAHLEKIPHAAIVWLLQNLRATDTVLVSVADHELECLSDRTVRENMRQHGATSWYVFNDSHYVRVSWCSK